MYGPDVSIENSVAPFLAFASGFGQVALSWSTPANNNWFTLVLVRNIYGFAQDPSDGDIILTTGQAGFLRSHDDTDLSPGRFYYYTIFLANDFNPWDANITYSTGDAVTYSSSVWKCLADNVKGITPGTDATKWQVTTTTTLWSRAGDVATLAVGDHGYIQRMYDYTPRPYKVLVSEVTNQFDDLNAPYLSFLSIFGFHLDMVATELDNLLGLYDTETMSLARLLRLQEELGLGDLTPDNWQQRRILTHNAALIERAKGTPTGIREILTALTGWGVDVAVGPNLMLDSDQTSWIHPIYPDWDPTISYIPGDAVVYNGFVYSAAAGTPAIIEGESLIGTATGTYSRLDAEVDHPYITFHGGAQLFIDFDDLGQYVTLTFSVPTTGTYDISVVPTLWWDYGIVSYKVDSTLLLDAFNGYSYHPRNSPAIYLGRMTLNSGSHTFTVTFVEDEAASEGFNAGVDYLILNPVGTTIVGQAPSGSATNNTYWTYRSAVSDTTTLANPITLSQSTWDPLVFGGASTTGLLFNSTANAARDGSNHATNYGAVQNTGVSTVDFGGHSVGKAATRAWAANVSYVTGNLVTWNGHTYQAILPSVGATPDDPDVGPTYWEDNQLGVGVLDRHLLNSYGVPLPSLPVWNPQTTYAIGTQVVYANLIYRANITNLGTPPSGRPGDTQTWEYIGPEQTAYTASFYALAAQTPGLQAEAYIEWYDEASNLISSIGSPTNFTLTQSFIEPFTTLSGNFDNTNAKIWTTSGGTFADRAGMVFRDPSQSSSSGMRVGSVSDGRADASVGITFRTATAAATIEHGIAFRLTDANNFWMVGRSALKKIQSGVVSTIATWTALPDGGRIIIKGVGSTLTVSKYAGPTLANVVLYTGTQSFNSTATKHGIFERDSVIGP